MTGSWEGRAPRSRWVLLAALAFAAAAVGIASEFSDHCADYTTGRRCTDFAYVLVVLSCACAAIAVIGVLFVTIRAIVGRHRKAQ